MRSLLFLLLGLGAYLAASTLFPLGRTEKTQRHVFDCRGALRKIEAEKGVGFGCEGEDPIETIESRRSLRSRYPPSPPPPVKNKQKAMTVPAAPPKTNY